MANISLPSDTGLTSLPSIPAPQGFIIPEGFTPIVLDDVAQELRGPDGWQWKYSAWWLYLVADTPMGSIRKAYCWDGDELSSQPAWLYLPAIALMPGEVDLYMGTLNLARALLTSVENDTTAFVAPANAGTLTRA